MVLAGKAIKIFACVAALTVFAAGSAFAQDVIGCIDPNQVLFQHPKFEQVQNQLKDILSKKEQEAKTAFDKETNDQKKQEILNSKRKEMSMEEQKLIQPIYKDIDLAIRAVSQAKKITVVVDKNAIFYGGVDITNDVITELKKK